MKQDDRQNEKYPSAKSVGDMHGLIRVRESLLYKPRDMLLFDLITQTTAPIRTILLIRIGYLKNVNIGDNFPLSPNHDSRHTAIMNAALYRTFHQYIEKTKASDNDYIFKSRKGDKPLLLSSVSRMVKNWFKNAGYEELNGALALRKAWRSYCVDNASRNIVFKEDNEKPNVLKRIKVTTAQQTVFNELESAICSGRIKPGEKLTLEYVARQMGVSRIPVREAFGRLEALGFITTLPKKGSIVNKLSVEDIEEIYEIRLLLEPIACYKAATHPTEETIRLLESLHMKFVAAIHEYDIETIMMVNKNFHHALYRDANMPILKILLDYLWSRTSPYLHILFQETEWNDPEEDIKVHEMMLEATKQKDPESLVKWLRTDLEGARKLIIRLFSLNRIPTQVVGEQPFIRETKSALIL